jgi:hypothetical protein
MAASYESKFPASVESNEDHVFAANFMEEFRAKPNIKYGWVSSYARDLWDERKKVHSLVDEKADSIVKYLGGGTGIFAILALSKVDINNAYLIGWALPAVLCAIISLFFAALARRPTFSPNLPTVDSAIGYAEEDENEEIGKTNFLGQWTLACEDMRLAIEIKSRYLVWSSRFYCIALALLLLPLAAAFCMPPPSSR